MVDFAKELLSSMSGNVTRSSAMASLQWAFAGELAALSVCTYGGAPTWLLVTLAVFSGVTLVAYLGQSVFFARTEPDLLRSEKYAINKMAIERGIVGDSLKGIVDVPDATPVLKIGSELQDEDKE